MQRLLLRRRRVPVRCTARRAPSSTLPGIPAAAAILSSVTGVRRRVRRLGLLGAVQAVGEAGTELGGVEQGETGVDDLEEDFDEVEGEAVIDCSRA